jgi:hypothetical protein
MVAEQAATAPLDHRRRQRQIARVAGEPGERDERRLDLGVPVEARLSALGAEAPDGEVGEAAGDVEQVVAPGPASERDRGLDQVPGAVQLVALVEVLPALLGVHSLDPGVEVAVLVLGLAEQRDGVVDPPAPAAVAGAVRLPPDGLEHLVDVGVGEPQAAELAGPRIAEAAKVVEVAARLQPLDAVIDRRGAVQCLPAAEQPVPVQLHVARVERPQTRVTHGALPRVRALPHRSSRVGNKRKSLSRKLANELPRVKIQARMYACRETGGT